MLARYCLIALLVIIPFCQGNPLKQVARLLPSAKAAAESPAIRESMMEIGKMMLKDAKGQRAYLIEEAKKTFNVLTMELLVES
ncbi:hypothetical protein T4B_12555 [Trichinella pseudospiralis]|uniref:Uncharacterized protein n=1 Tax=Trichinella pseudospiralis TaxID=6337 RepID=A0A0V1IZ28_TRIPS|nr:hypothetical protein T4E_8713 [Trichinella pseudospiralis]KRY71697.1 hypothetical protein T4A_338 [Trichinella pseudospiralis]KRZ27977.1 hypothetical protein T4B_12555 [Trichinella pseudospiralis]KRZ42380.1 hypothetical protein T4C_11918 [Trichinella pseudospiralis]